MLLVAPAFPMTANATAVDLEVLQASPSYGESRSCSSVTAPEFSKMPNSQGEASLYDQAGPRRPLFALTEPAKGRTNLNVYRLDPIDLNHAAWQFSCEQDSVWAGASTPINARELVAKSTRTGAPKSASPWEDETVTSCVLEPTMTHIDAGAVVRADGSGIG